MPTFGFQTERHVGAEAVRALSEDPRTTHRWYVVVEMGRQAGHLAPGISSGIDDANIAAGRPAPRP